MKKEAKQTQVSETNSHFYVLFLKDINISLFISIIP